MRIAVVGLGVAGSYLLTRLSQEHEVVGFERQPLDKFTAICAWGTSKHELSRILSQADMDFGKYILHEGRHMYVDCAGKMLDIPLKGLVTFDKHQMELDLAKGHDPHYGVKADRESLEKGGYDLIVDATGNHRVLLPKIKDDLYIPCIEYKVRYNPRPPSDDFYIKPFPGDSGYLWYFPLEEGYGYVGAGDYNRHHLEYTDEYNRAHGGEIVKKLGRPIRFTPPELCQPFFDGNVVGVGESIGTIFPILGEGIIPSLQCADLLLENLSDMEAYRKAVLEHFRAFYDVYKLVKLKIEGRFNFAKHSPLLLKTYRYMKQREERFGITIRSSDLYQIIRM